MYKGLLLSPIEVPRIVPSNLGVADCLNPNPSIVQLKYCGVVIKFSVIRDLTV